MSDDIDVGQISEALNDKLDRDAGNPALLGTQRISGWGMPSGTYESITIGANDSTYTAPANGYFSIKWYPTVSGGWTEMRRNGNFAHTERSYGNSNGWYQYYEVSVKSGDILMLRYDPAACVIENLYFIYAKGEENV